MPLPLTPLPEPARARRSSARETLKLRLRRAVAGGLAPEARVRATQRVFGPYSPFPVAFRVMGPDVGQVRAIAEKVRKVMLDSPSMRTVNTDWTERVPTIHFTLDQDRLRAIGLSSNDAAEQLQFLLTGVPVTQLREDIRTVAFIPLTTSVFWGSLAYTLIGGTAVGTVLTLLFLPALYAIWFRVRPTASGSDARLFDLQAHSDQKLMPSLT